MTANSIQFPAAVKRPSLKAHEWAGLIGLASFVLVSRIPLRSQVLYHWDSVNFAYAMQEFNLAKEQPQPPGYLLYVWLCRLVDFIFHDPQTTMVAISIAASLISVLGMYFVGKAMYNERVGWLSAGFLAVSPLFWFYGEIALPHTLDTVFVVWSVYSLYRAMHGSRGHLFLAVVLLAVAGGIRQQTLVFLAPLALFAVRKAGWKNIIAAAALGAALCLAWFIPLMQLSGGMEAYFKVMGDFSRRFQSTTSLFAGAGWWGLRRNATKLILYSAYGWNIVIVPVAAIIAQALFAKRKISPGERSVFVTLWIAPAALFYLLVHMGQQGLVFVFLPAFLIVSAAALDKWLAAHIGVIVFGLLLMVISGSIFYFTPEYPLGPGTQRLLTRQTIANSDAYYLDRFRAIQEHFSPERTLIIAGNWHHVEYYLPSYQRVSFNVGGKWEVDEGHPVNQMEQAAEYTPSELGLSTNEVEVIIFDPELVNFSRNPELIRSVAMEKGDMYYFSLQGQDRLYLSNDSYGVVRR